MPGHQKLITAFKESFQALVDEQIAKQNFFLENTVTYSSQGELIEILHPEHEKLPKLVQPCKIATKRSKEPSPEQTAPPSEEEGVIPEDFEMANMLEDDAKINQCEANNFNIRKIIKAGRGVNITDGERRDVGPDFLASKAFLENGKNQYSRKLYNEKFKVN